MMRVRIMERIRSKIAILVMFLAVGGTLHAGEPLSIRNCTWCHGTGAQGFTTAPRLAGQRQQYIMNQLLDFNHHTRDNPLSKQYMWAAAENLNSQVARDLAAYFSALPPRAANDGDSELTARGKEIYELGIADSNVVACVVCHGPKAEGIRQIPRLGGLTHSYLKKRLEQWGQGFHAKAELMPQIASTLSADDIEALASYLSFIE
jgi:cytochrome c553